ncbi:MAG TPA: helix-turn-helix domain-containing protein [Ktedonobacterales bacterium]|nr:helix-turn-helix domain-containing protein [Ktedonobacterales bacterium]
MATVHKTYQEKLKPTPAQERELERTLWRCRILSNTALEQRSTLWKQRGVSLTRSQQEAELKDLRAEVPEYGALHDAEVQPVWRVRPKDPLDTDASLPLLRAGRRPRRERCQKHCAGGGTAFRDGNRWAPG